jgi:predicted metal-binding transcription factor (methanogenesis marker protein 9)
VVELLKKLLSNCGMPIAECGLHKKTKKSEIRNPQSEIAESMLFPRNALASGPQACFLAERGNRKSEGS